MKFYITFALLVNFFVFIFNAFFYPSKQSRFEAYGMECIYVSSAIDLDPRCWKL